MSVQGKFRVVIYSNSATARGRGRVKAIIDDAVNIGCSEYLNDGGEFFMTLPYNHPQMAAVSPLRTHYSVHRWNGSAYDEIFNGLVTDMDATPDEVVFYGENYLNLLQTTIDNNLVTYSNQEIGSIFSAEFSNAISGDNTQQGRLGFMTVGTVNTTGQSTTVISAYTPRLDFLKGLADIVSSNTTSLPVFYISRTSPFTFEFRSHRSTTREEILLEYGGLVNDFRYIPYGPEFATYVRGIGQKREGATVLYSTQTWASESEFGHIARAKVYIDVVNQTALDRMVKKDARKYGATGQRVALALRVNGLAPWDGYDLGDKIRIKISRGPVEVNQLYTLSGLEWIGRADGTEELYFSVLLPTDNVSCETVTDYSDAVATVWSDMGSNAGGIYGNPWANPNNVKPSTSGDATTLSGVTYLGELYTYLKCDLGSSLRITKIVIDHSVNGWMVKLQSSDNGTTWTDAWDPLSGFPDDPQTVEFEQPITARYWRLASHWINADGEGHWKYYSNQQIPVIHMYGCPAV